MAPPEADIPHIDALAEVAGTLPPQIELARLAADGVTRQLEALGTKHEQSAALAARAAGLCATFAGLTGLNSRVAAEFTTRSAGFLTKCRELGGTTIMAGDTPAKAGIGLKEPPPTAT